MPSNACNKPCAMKIGKECWHALKNYLEIKFDVKMNMSQKCMGLKKLTLKLMKHFLWAQHSNLCVL